MSSGSYRIISAFFVGRSEKSLARRSFHSLVRNVGMGSTKVSDVRSTGDFKSSYVMLSTAVAVPKQKPLINTVVSNIHSSEKKVGPRTMPTRHSRHHFPPVAPFSDLKRLTDDFLAAEPGSLFVYDPSKNLSLNKNQQYEEGLKVSDAWRRKVEFILRGYSALFPKSVVDVTTDDAVDEYTMEKISSKTEGDNIKDNSFAEEMIHKFKHNHIPDEKMQPDLYQAWLKKRSEISESSQLRQETITSMQKILERLELEADVYVSMWAKHKSNRMELAAVSATKKLSDSEPDFGQGSDATSSASTSSRESSEMNDDEIMISDELTSDENLAWGLQTLTKSYGAPPGPSIQMYDLLLDAIATGVNLGVDHPSAMIQASKALQSRAIDRYTLDVNAKMDPYNIIPTAPTILTFNAVIRAAALAKYDIHDALLRDVAIDAAFTTFDIMYRLTITDATIALGFQPPKRNSATYLYMLKTVAKYFPISPTRGNIAHSLFVKAAVEEGVLDELIFETLLYSISPTNVSHSENFDKWVEGIRERFGKFKYCYGFPSKWSMNKKSRRYNKKIALY